MQFFTVSVMLAGDRNQIVANKGPISVPEIAILRHIHGDTSVFNLRHSHTSKTTNGMELRDQLRATYESATPGERTPIVDRLFSPMGPLPKTLADIGIDGKAEADRLRAEAERAAQAAEAMAASIVPDDDEIDLAFLDETAPETATAKRK